MKYWLGVASVVVLHLGGAIVAILLAGLSNANLSPGRDDYSITLTQIIVSWASAGALLLGMGLALANRWRWWAASVAVAVAMAATFWLVGSTRSDETDYVPDKISYY